MYRLDIAVVFLIRAFEVILGVSEAIFQEVDVPVLVVSGTFAGETGEELLFLRSEVSPVDPLLEQDDQLLTGDILWYQVDTHPTGIVGGDFVTRLEDAQGDR